jgi:predicted dehydrogenase
MLKMAIIGCGGMARAHVSRFSQGDRARVVATVDTDLDRAREAASHFEGARAVADYREIVREVDAALIVLPHHLHHPVGMDFLEAGRHVLMEKPLAITEQECLDLIGASERNRRVLMVGYCQRFNPLVVRLKELLDQRACGDVFQVSIWTEQHTERSPDSWMCRAATLGGGQFFSHGCHYIDLLLWYLGRPLEGTHTGTNYCTPWMEKEGTSHVCLKFRSRALGYHFGTWGAKGSRLKYSIHAHCTDGMLEAFLSGGKLILHQGGKETLLMESTVNKQTWEEMAHFLDCVETGQTPITDARSSLQGLRVIWRLYEAEERGVVADLRGCGLDETG